MRNGGIDFALLDCFSVKWSWSLKHFNRQTPWNQIHSEFPGRILIFDRLTVFEDVLIDTVFVPVLPQNYGWVLGGF